ncbi:hypothetical protein CJ030_MR1G008537 [Morella rubra]|uniref:Uncharacterized protein n=1 Tax=Morella rubra TaxID=262757 RepID=A0A6A1WLB8_9ROSI|nr:hypothetical protein CJ030_MR1G008537 [Morella rubra]
MVTGESKLNNRNRRSLPPTRGCIMINILRSMAVTIRRVLAGFGQKHSDTGTETEGYPSSTSTGPVRN